MKPNPAAQPGDLPTASALTPEQAGGQPVLPPQIEGCEILEEFAATGRRERVDTCTDVHSLGIVFYKLVTGRFPYDVNSSMLQTLQSIREQDPVQPSRLARHLDRDTEAIILRALEKEPDRRYQSVAELKADIDRRLEGLPVLACSGSSLYLLRKIVARHRYTSTVVVLLVVIVLGFLAFSLQLSASLRQTIRELVGQRELFFGQTAEFTGCARWRCWRISWTRGTGMTRRRPDSTSSSSGLAPAQPRPCASWRTSCR
jgi:hypothetical protein